MNSEAANSSISKLNAEELEFPWHQSCWDQFIQARTQNHLPHAILLTGEEGIGKFSLAQRMAKSLMCIDNVSNPSDACNTCQSCKTYESGANPDFTQITLLEDKQQIGVDQVRELSGFLNYSRSFNTTRVVIINPVERMNLNAANSLLKSLEEPTEHTVLILVTSKVSQLLPTIKSRCQSFTVNTPNTDESLNWIVQQQSKNQESSQKVINPEKLLEITGNKPLKAIQLSQDDVEARDNFFKDLSTVIQQQSSITEVAKKWEKNDLAALLNWQIIVVQNAIKGNLSSSTNGEKSKDATSSMTNHLSNEQQWSLYQELLKQKQYIHTSVNSLMFMENMIMLWLKAD